MKRKYSQHTDLELFNTLKENTHVSELAFGELYARYNQRIYAYCLRVTGNPDEARDIFQDTFLKFYKSAKSDRQVSNVPGYLLTIARNLCLNFKRDRKDTVAFEDYHKSYRNDGSYEKKEYLELIRTALELLDKDHREAFILREYQGMSYAEISDVTGVSVSALKNRVWRAKEKIKKILSRYVAEVSKL